MGNYGMKISKDGYDVKDASIKNLILTSEANQWKTHLKGSVTFTSGSQTVTIAHGLGYTPAFLWLYHSVYWTGDDANRYYWGGSSNNSADDTYLYVYGSDIGDIVQYVIFKDFGA